MEVEAEELRRRENCRGGGEGGEMGGNKTLEGAPSMSARRPPLIAVSGSRQGA